MLGPPYLRALFDELDLAVLVADDTGRYVDANRRALEIFGRPRDAVIGHGIKEFISADLSQGLDSQWAAFLRDGTQSGVIPITLPDGAIRVLAFHARANFVPGLHCSFLTPTVVPGPLDVDVPQVTVCAWTKRIRIGDEWVTLEEYLQRTQGLLVSHGISPDAFHDLAR